MWGEKKERCNGSIVEGEVAAGVGRVDKGGYLLRLEFGFRLRDFALKFM
jgi:hypothetical protein